MKDEVKQRGLPSRRTEWVRRAVYATPDGGAWCITELLASNRSTYRQTFWWPCVCSCFSSHSGMWDSSREI